MKNRILGSIACFLCLSCVFGSCTARQPQTPETNLTDPAADYAQAVREYAGVPVRVNTSLYGTVEGVSFSAGYFISEENGVYQAVDSQTQQIISCADFENTEAFFQRACYLPPWSEDPGFDSPEEGMLRAELSGEELGGFLLSGSTIFNGYDPGALEVGACVYTACLDDNGALRSYSYSFPLTVKEAESSFTAELKFETEVIR